jgi:small GTP-binding protein
MSVGLPRVITVGDSGVGKTALIHRMKTGEFLEQTSATVGAGVTAVEVDIGPQTIGLQIWDTAGQEMYRSVIPIYFKGSIYAVLAFAWDDVNSFQSLDSWMEQIAQHADPDIGIVLVGTKYDKHGAVSEDDARDFAEKHHLPLFFASSMTGQNVSVILEHVAGECAKRTAVEPEKEQRLVEKGVKQKQGCC